MLLIRSLSCLVIESAWTWICPIWLALPWWFKATDSWLFEAATSLRLIRSVCSRSFTKNQLFQLGCYRPQCKDRVVNEEDNKSLKSLKEWLKNKKENSVVYIAFGTESTLSQENESRVVTWDRKIRVAFHLGGQEPPTYWRVNGSGYDSRWIWNPSCGLVWTGWVPQLKALAHPSIGDFLTYCGWNSVIEALGFGRVLILFFGSNSDQGLMTRLLNGRQIGNT